MMKIPVWIPIRSLGNINVYLLDKDGSPFLIDSGMLTGRSILDLAEKLRRAGYNLCSIGEVALTHFHVDHSTTTLLLDQIGSPLVYIGEGDYNVIKSGVEEFIRSALSLFLDNGMPREEAERILSNHPAYRFRDVFDRMADEIEWRPLREGERVEAGEAVLEVIEVPGHTPGHLAYVWREKNAAFLGDTVLPRITPHVTVHNWATNPLRDYLASLERIASLDLKIGYPGHREDLPDPAGRAREIIEHHRERLQNIIEILEKEGVLTGYEIAKRIKWRVRYQSWEEYPDAEKFFAMGEALAHLRYLEEEGRIEKTSRGGHIAWRLAR